MSQKPKGTSPGTVIISPKNVKATERKSNVAQLQARFRMKDVNLRCKQEKKVYRRKLGWKSQIYLNYAPEFTAAVHIHENKILKDIISGNCQNNLEIYPFMTVHNK